MSTHKPPGRFVAEGGLALVALLWGATFVLVKDALNDVSTVLFLAIRFTAATVALGLVTRPKIGPWKGGIFTGMLLFTGYLLQTLGLRWTTAAKSGFITGLYIVLVPLVSAVVYKKAPHWAELAGVILATVGLGLLSFAGTSLQMGIGDLLTIGCAVAYAVHIVVLGHYSRRMDHSWLALLQLGTCGVIGLSTFWWVEPSYVKWSGRVWLALAVTSLLATALAFAIQTWAQRHTSATRAAIIFSLEPVFAWVTAFLVAGEVLTGRSVVGAFLILAGILLVELKPARVGEHHNVQSA